MQADTQAQVAFYLTGRRAADALDPVDGLGLRPALFAGYENLTPLRYDFPVVLETQGHAPAHVASLCGLFDEALRKASIGADGERVRKHGLRVEQEIRSLVAGGASGTLSALFEQAASRITVPDAAAFHDSLRRIRATLVADGEVADCDAALPRRLLQHVWHVAQEAKAVALRAKVNRLTLKLQAILRADAERSARAMQPDHLQATFGPGFAPAFDFEAMSRMLGKPHPRAGLPAARKRRIQQLLRALKAQRFVEAGPTGSAAATYPLVFDSCAAALKAWRERQPRMVELARALAVAELEVAGDYDPARHDALFDGYGANGLDAADQAQFPALLVHMGAARLDGPDNGKLMAVLGSGLPIKVLLQIDDLAGSAGLHSRQAANLAMGLNTAYVLQSSASNLVRFRERLAAGIAYPGPALFSVYSGATAAAAALPPYLMAAAAMESRAFPAFAYDPSAGDNWAERFTLDANPQADADWPVRRFAYEDEQHQLAAEDLAFTVVDFLAADQRLSGHLARVPREKWNGSMLAVPQSLATPGHGLPDKVPTVLMVDAQDRLQRVVVDQSLIGVAAQYRDMWHSLQELGGIHNSHAQRLLAREQEAWQQQARPEPAAAAVAAPVAATSPAPAASPAADTAVAEEPQRNPDEAYIETERCSTCNECTQINNKMFAYNGNQQAYIKDITAGTYAQLVEAAESCQVAVIHPGKPRNPNEPGLEELLKRAAAFA